MIRISRRRAAQPDESVGEIALQYQEGQRPGGPDPSALGRTVRRFGVALSVLATLAMMATAIGIVLFHVGFQPVLSGSMRPTFSPGSLVMTRPIPTRNVRTGDVILFTPPGQASPFAHRVTSVSGPADRPVIKTKGDANPVADPWKLQLVHSQVPEVIGAVPGIGRLAVAVHKHGSRVILIAVGGLIFCLVGTRSILGSRPLPPTVQTPGVGPS